MKKFVLILSMGFIFQNVVLAGINNQTDSESVQIMNLKSKSQKKSKSSETGILTTNVISTEQKKSLLSFYTNEEFPRNVFSTIHANVTLSTSSITPADLKAIFPKKCDILLDQIAQAVKQEVSDVHLNAAKDLARICPEWKNLDRDDKSDFYVALVTSMALAESSCNNRINNRKASNGTARGLWQLRKSMTPVAGARWTMNQIERQIQKSGLIFWDNSNLNYWAVLNPDIHDYKVKNQLKKIPACFVRGLAEEKTN